MSNAENRSDPHRYDDMIDLPHHVSGIHRPMTMLQRAAMFHPFMPLSGFQEKIREVERVTEPRRELDEDEKERLNRSLMQLQRRLTEEHAGPFVRITYFMPDKTKPGGAYVTKAGRLTRIDMIRRKLILTEDEAPDEAAGTASLPAAEIPIDEISEIES